MECEGDEDQCDVGNWHIGRDGDLHITWQCTKKISKHKVISISSHQKILNITINRQASLTSTCSEFLFTSCGSDMHGMETFVQ